MEKRVIQKANVSQPSKHFKENEQVLCELILGVLKLYQFVNELLDVKGLHYVAGRI